MPLHPQQRPFRRERDYGRLGKMPLPPLLKIAMLTFAGTCSLSCQGNTPAQTDEIPRRPSSADSELRAVRAPSPIPVGAPVGRGARTENERNSVAVFRQVAPSTVYVTQKRVVTDFFGRATSEVPAGTGSGFVWDKLGHIVTNFHVIQGAQAVSVTLHDHRNFAATLVGTERRKDIAVLKLVKAPKDLIPISLSSERGKYVVGQKALAIGNPFGLDQTLTTGVVSALGREVKGIGGVTIRDMIQTDAAINPGNSGGPLLDSAGQLIGMNTMIFSRSGSSAGIGFAVPSTTIRRVVPQIIQTGKAEQVGFGVHVDFQQRLERRLGIKGVIILRVLPNTPAARAKLRGIRRTAGGLDLGDVIVGVNDQPVRDYDDLYNILDTFKPGSSVLVSVRREGQLRKVRIPLQKLQ